jgi:hypothetical protein
MIILAKIDPIYTDRITAAVLEALFSNEIASR